jgi:galactokinase
MNQRAIEEVFSAKFGGGERRIVVRSPGRINLVGEHTDYNEGFVLPAAIGRAIWFVAAPRTDNSVCFAAANLNEEFICNLDSLEKTHRGWPNYLLGVLDQISRTHGIPGGCNVAFGGDIPIGAGLSSSAALECGFALALDAMFSLGIGRAEIARICQRAEQEFVGVQCGLMDQFANLFGRAANVIRLDCRTLEYEHIPFEMPDVCIVLVDSGIGRSLSDSRYNTRRSECEEGAAFLRNHEPSIKTLRDVSIDILRKYEESMDRVLFNRCAYVVRENERVIAAAEALRRRDPESLGKAMLGSHLGLCAEFEVSTPELEILVNTAMRVRGVYGSRMMGGGFGGCTITLVQQSQKDYLIETVSSVFHKATGREVTGQEVSPGPGSSIIEAR